MLRYITVRYVILCYVMLTHSLIDLLGKQEDIEKPEEFYLGSFRYCGLYGGCGVERRRIR